MFLNKTVFILGAGASWHYGYPTGEDLVREVLAKAHVFQRYCSKMYRSDDLYAVEQLPRYLTRNSGPIFTDGVAGMKREWNAGAMEAGALIQRLSAVDPIVIDYFLGHNPDLKDIGKFLIAWVLLECEADYVSKNGNPNRRKMLARSSDPGDRENANRVGLSSYKDNWYRFLIHKLAVGCSADTDLLTKNDVTFITFNYDVSLEYRLFKGLSAISKFEETSIVNEFMKPGRVTHVYGKIRGDPFADPLDFDRKLSSFELDPTRMDDGSSRLYKNFCDNIYAASQEIRTVAPEEKT